MTNTPKRYDPNSMRSTFDTNGGDSLLENCVEDFGEAVFFCSENVRHPGTVRQQKRRYTRPGFEMVEIIYDHDDGRRVRSIKYLLINGEEYRAENTPENAYSMQILTKPSR